MSWEGQVIGDAAHSMSPQLGQGANLALIDAEKLVDVLEEAAGVSATSASNIETALDAYTKERYAFQSIMRSGVTFSSSKWASPTEQVVAA
jgi:2-polyprenyl-6-methoxyphenol hydroxylase-like FAD-dependent oxidoreductase